MVERVMAMDMAGKLFLPVAILMHMTLAGEIFRRSDMMLRLGDHQCRRIVRRGCACGRQQKTQHRREDDDEAASCTDGPERHDQRVLTRILTKD